MAPPRCSRRWMGLLGRAGRVRLLLGLLLLLGLVLAGHAAAQPHRPLLPGFGGLCDGGPLPCTRIDTFAFNARADVILLTGSDRRGPGLVAPYGFSIGLLERLEGGLSTHTAVWGPGPEPQPEPSPPGPRWQQGPLRFAVKGLLWPWVREPHQRFTALLAFEYEARLPRFDGPNQLGLRTDLAALRGVVGWPLGRAELGLAAGVLFAAGAGYGTVELGARAGLHLPFLPDTKVFVEGLWRGSASRIGSDGPLPGAADPARPIGPGGAVGLGIVTRPRRQVDFALVVHAGFGDVAPLFVLLRFADIAWGKGYPYPRSLAADLLREAGELIAEQIRKLPASARETCVLYDRAGQPLATLGRRTPDGAYCEWQGHSFRLGDELYPDPARGRICLDAGATRCVGVEAPGVPLHPLEAEPAPPEGSSRAPGASSPLGLARLGALARHQGALGPLRRVPGQLGPDCKLYEGDSLVSPIGHLSADGKHCEIRRLVRTHRGSRIDTAVRTERLPVGGALYRDPQTGWVCTRAGARGRRDCPVALDPEHSRPLTDAERARQAFSEGGIEKAAGAARQVRAATELLTDPAKLSTFAAHTEEQAQRLAEQAVAAARDPRQAVAAAGDSLAAAGRGLDRQLQDFGALSRGQKLDRAFRFLGGAAVEAIGSAGAGAVLGGVVRSGETALEAAAEARKLERGTRAAKVAEEAAGLENAVQKGARSLDPGAARRELPRAQASNTPDQDALIQLAKEKKKSGITQTEGKVLREWGQEYKVPVRGPEVHPNRPFGKEPHLHVGSVDHIPVKP